MVFAHHGIGTLGQPNVSPFPPGDQGGINPIQVGLGMQIGSIDQLWGQGNIETTGQNTDLAIQGDSLRLTQAMVNLLNNAAKYTPGGGDIYLTAAKRGSSNTKSVTSSQTAPRIRSAR